MGVEYVELPFLQYEETISEIAWGRITVAFNCVAQRTNEEKKDLRIQEKVQEAESDGYDTLEKLRELNVRTLRNELQWPMLVARQFVRVVTAMSFVAERDVRVEEDDSGEKFFSLELSELSGEVPRRPKSDGAQNLMLTTFDRLTHTWPTCGSAV